MSAPSGSLVAYSTAPGSVASDGADNNGLYTEYLAKVIRQPGLPVEEVFKQVRASVRKASNNQQTPWENTALEGQFFFKSSIQVAAAFPVQTPSAKPGVTDPVAVELVFWDSIKSSQRQSELQAYLAQYPEGAFARLAKARLLEMNPKALADKPIVQNQIGAESSGDIGTLELTDTISGAKRKVAVSTVPSDEGHTAYSTGDIVAKDGSIIQLAVGR